MHDRLYSSPLYHDGLIYNKCNAAEANKYHVVVFDAATGQVIYRSQPRAVNKSTDPHPCLTLAGGHIYGGFDSGQMWVFKPGREFHEVATNTLIEKGDQMTSSPFCAGSRIYIRSHKFLWCLGNK